MQLGNGVPKEPIQSQLKQAKRTKKQQIRTVPSISSDEETDIFLGPSPKTKASSSEISSSIDNNKLGQSTKYKTTTETFSASDVKVEDKLCITDFFSKIRISVRRNLDKQMEMIHF